MVGRDIVIQSGLGVKEIERFFHIVNDALVGVPVNFVGGANHLYANVAVLHIDIRIQPRQEVVHQFAVDVEIGLLGILIVIGVVRHQFADRHLHPFDLSEVVAIILVPAATERSLQILVVVVVQRGHYAVEVVVHLLLAHQVALGPSHLRVEVILKKCPFTLVLLVVAAAFRVVQCRIEVQFAVQPLVPYQLVVLLMIVVCLSIVIVYIALRIVVLTTGIIGTSIQALLIFRRIVPGMVGFLNTVPGDQLHHRIV